MSECSNSGCRREARPGRKCCQACVDYTKKWQARRTPEQTQREVLRKKLKPFGLTAESYSLLIESQDNRCALCRKSEWVIGSHGKVKALAIDHDHETGVVRGLLCNNCNRAIGLLNDSPELMRLAAEYVERGKVAG